MRYETAAPLRGGVNEEAICKACPPDKRKVFRITELNPHCPRCHSPRVTFGVTDQQRAGVS